MIEKEPLKSLLHAVAPVKADFFDIIRVVYDLYSVNLASSLGVLQVLLVFAFIIIIHGSIRIIY
ncbi:MULTISPECIES: hypothetical protein [unclassified Colwellia]|jgi:hypothetical protein|uniref:hypothetical protein n=1 Tax=unclassified Colwellia TaxID=196834 RepID=UPI0015F47C16|nr:MULTISPECIES: hypothetical protein [unclassified Colwellia]MBA6251712.1 hypothetical protein [Colwellia sp. MB3u-55]MBA6398328.1 hypothetical protein [Colwellia sp. BRX10-4]